jgi:hypothetical protein
MSLEVLTNTNSIILTYEHWKCEKCDNLFWVSKELRRHKQEYHAY